jgi:hypothetical protein
MIQHPSTPGVQISTDAGSGARKRVTHVLCSRGPG